MTTIDQKIAEYFQNNFGLGGDWPWGNLILSSHAGDTYGNWGFVAGPTAAYGGGSWMGISELSTKKEWKLYLITKILLMRDGLWDIHQMRFLNITHLVN